MHEEKCIIFIPDDRNRLPPRNPRRSDNDAYEFPQLCGQYEWT